MAFVDPASQLSAREAMIESQLKPCGIIDPRTAAAFFAVPREAYVAPGREEMAYVDAPQPLGRDSQQARELLMPLSLGHLIEQARITSADRVLIIGTGTGYSAAVVAHLAGSVVAVESDAGLAMRARANLVPYANVRCVEGALDAGSPSEEGYTLLLIDGGAVQQIPQALTDQLVEGGRVAAILLGDDGVTRVVIGHKQNGQIYLEPIIEAPASLLLPFAKAPAFRF